MCLIAFSYRQHPRYDLIFLANRDEFYSRPTRAAQYWEEHPGLLAGKDIRAGGTWLGINRLGEFSALTNLRDPEMRSEDAPSRGNLVLDFLTNRDSAEAYLERVNRQANLYNGFNLLAGRMDQLFYYSNKTREFAVVSPGLHGLSNHLLDTPWPKVRNSKQALSEQVGKDTIDKEKLFEILKNDRSAPDEDLPDTGIPLELERAVSPVFIKTGEYGTRCSTVILVEGDGTVFFEERLYKPGTIEVDEVNSFEFVIEQG